MKAIRAQEHRLAEAIVLYNRSGWGGQGESARAGLPTLACDVRGARRAMYHVTKRQTSKLIACKLVSSTGTPSSTATCSCGQLGSAKPAPARSRQYSSTAVLQRFRGGTSLADQLAAPQRQKQDDAPESAAESTEKPAYGAAKQDSNSSSGIHQLLDSALADRERAVERNRARKLAQKSVRRTKHATKKHKDESVMAGEEAEKRGGGNGRDAKHREDSASAGELAVSLAVHAQGQNMSLLPKPNSNYNMQGESIVASRRYASASPRDPP